MDSRISRVVVCVAAQSLLCVAHPVAAQDAWNTFLGSAAIDYATDIAVDDQGNTYIAGCSLATWGMPVRAHAGGNDAFVAKVAPRGTLLWLTFLGSTEYDSGESISVDDSGAVYVAGVSYATWGGPIAPFAGQADAFVAKLDSSGTLEWNTFLGSNEWDGALGVSAGAGGVLVTGPSNMSWGAPIRAFQADLDVFVARLNPDGAMDWNTFLGGSGDDRAKDVAVDSNSGYIYVMGDGNVSWGSPVRPFIGVNSNDAFVAQLDDGGVLQWNTFLGGTSDDDGWGIAVDSDGDLLATGKSGASWGTPIRPFGGLHDVYVTKIDHRGNLQWHTFLGSPGDDAGLDVAVDPANNVYVTGHSYMTWGTPLLPFTPFAMRNAFVTGLNGSGAIEWHTFLGMSIDDGWGIAYHEGAIYAAGLSAATWGKPIQAHAGSVDAFVAKMRQPADVSVVKTANASSVGVGEIFEYSIAVTNNGPGRASGLGVLESWPGWLIYVSATSSQGHYDTATGIWEVGDLPQGALAELSIKARAVGPGTITNAVAKISQNEDDPDTTNDAFSVTITAQ